ncbi:hypothetical protein [Tuwongella immobilis]|uniref:Mg-chelatase subunit: Uncharacterized protein n=1 Tax=Tuwongella immobilis TaxID=692036 RepID=A0A6C2YTW2_9BACT|nr:hypothetical protein [Tuwongella immobilis]VIP04355.1 mg-chelatase subunit : Uncharacterized protein OS=Planctomyces maris DSM 8797 GN=PM8797T_31608 PE=4 SV=1 [Tuwongella immobilis]VTS06072.1 mg-chelatase subunit : Uncharacterized protein OS=Planctomyces maris DSM 8797 GN=PM8797T_31608 PE=4 SV=1 [Tuwongella immobilis]
MRIMGRLLAAFLVLSIVSEISAQAIRETDIQAAVKRGADYLKQYYAGQGGNGLNFGGGGAVVGGGHPSGERSLAAVAMLEAGIPATDPVIQAMAKFVREDAIAQTKTYEVSLAIMFLDRLGDSKDKPLIQMLALRLLAGQNANGGWTYSAVGSIPANEIERIRTGLANPTKPAELNTPAANKEKDSPLAGKVDPLVAGHLDALRQMRANGGVGGAYEGMGDDNSNTQFATLALWIARRHNVNTDVALQGVARRFRISQIRANGAWDYIFGMVGGGGKPSMTCSGLLGLLMSYGVAAENNNKANTDFKKDPAITAGFNYLGASIRRAVPGGNQVAPMIGGDGMGVTTTDYYFLWSLERVCAIADADKITGIDWFQWGATHLLRQQKQDGSWAGSYGGHIDTCFAVLFLCKANLARDLTQTLTGRAGPAVGLGGRTRPNIPGVSDPTAMRPKPELPSPLTAPRPTQRPGDAVPPSGSAAELASKLVELLPGPFETKLQEYHDAKGTAYTEAMAQAAAQLDGDRQSQTREKLAYRLSRFSADTLRNYLGNRDAELRRAATLAAAIRGESKLIPDLIARLDDEVATVSRSAYAALKSLTNEDFGPKTNATVTERAAASAAWRRWWKQQQQ